MTDSVQTSAQQATGDLERFKRFAPKAVELNSLEVGSPPWLALAQELEQEAKWIRHAAVGVLSNIFQAVIDAMRDDVSDDPALTFLEQSLPNSSDEVH